LFAGSERQRFSELNRHTAQELVYIIDSADVSAASEIRHIEAIIWAQTRNAETGGYMKAGTRTTIVRIAGKRRTPAGDVNHLPLGKCFVKILGEPDRPLITQSLFSPSLSVYVHYKCSKNLLFFIICKSTDSRADLTAYRQKNDFI